jgi:DNA-directed RNA polymerase subunit RPC12/RpoP
MYGRYGSDGLGLALIIISIALSVVTMFIPVPFIGLVSLAPLFFCIYRMFSRDISRRQRENYTFRRFCYKVKGFFTGFKSRTAQRKLYRFYACPHCGQKVRVPRGKGAIRVKCPKCGAKFSKKT